MKGAGMNERGFTLVELLVVIAIIGVLMGIAAFNAITNVSSTSLKRAARDVATELNAARHRAISQNMQYNVTFTLSSSANDSFRRYFRANTSDAWSVDPTRNSRDVSNYVNISSPSANFIVVFSPNGSSNGAVICLENKADTNNRRKITIYSATGRIQVEDDC